MDDEGKWRGRFHAYMAARLGGLAVFLAGLAVAFTGLVRPGGDKQIGAVLVILGILDALFLPRLVKKRWEKRDSERR